MFAICTQGIPEPIVCGCIHGEDLDSDLIVYRKDTKQEIECNITQLKSIYNLEILRLLAKGRKAWSTSVTDIYDAAKVEGNL